MQKPITKTAVDGLAVNDTIWDTGKNAVCGFGVRRQKQDAFYVLKYSIHGRRGFITIGRHGSPWTPDLARKEAKRLTGLVADGKDPQAEKTAARLAAADTFEGSLDRYLKHKEVTLKPRPYDEVKRHLQKHCKPLHRLSLSEIDRRTVAARLGEIETASGPVARNRVRSSLSAFFNWCIREGLLETNPVLNTGKAQENGSRERVLTDKELKEIWNASGEGGFADIVKLLILTGQRREEIGGLRWSEVQGDVIVLPPERVKNRKEHTVPLSAPAKAIFDARKRNGRELVFGIGEGGFSGWSDAKETMPVFDEPWTLHDIRRTAATVMADRLDILPHIVEAILNHVSGHKAGVAGVYNRARYLPQMREALDRWAEHVMKLTL
jgi:integrase